MVRRFRLFVARLIAALVFDGPVKVGSSWFDPATGRIVPAQVGAEDPTPDPTPEPTPDPDPTPDPTPDPDPDPGPDPDDPPDPKKEPDWKRESRKHERRAKQEREAREALQKKLDDIEASNKSEQEKAIDKAKAEAKAEATGEFEQQRRDDKIENTVTKLSLKGFKVKDGEDEKTLKFADPDDAQLRLDRALRNGDLAHDDIYQDGKVDTDAVTAFLTEVLEDHPRLRAEDSSQRQRRVEGGADGGKGKGAGKGLEDMSPDDHLKEIQGSR